MGSIEAPNENIVWTNMEIMLEKKLIWSQFIRVPLSANEFLSWLPLA